MPTGYTAGIEDGSITTLEQYALTCARAFGATISLRDEPMSTPIPDEIEDTDSQYHICEIKEAEQKLQKLHGLAANEIEKLTNEFIEEQKVFVATNNEEQAKIKLSYEKMLTEIGVWKVPATLNGLREFMIEQIELCKDSLYFYFDEEPITASEWHSKQIKKFTNSIEYHTKELEKSKERNDERNAWIKALKTSLLKDLK